ncbi:MAG TPA: hypothetical protein VN213_18450, partial [Solirubrobacteraceae bacterium]|nr:hypothetical protein [Solirubrobacteraceae bacterium]
MPRRLLAVLLALVAVLLAPAAARAAWFPAEPLDGPSPDVVALDDLDVARDGTGAIVWRRLVDGVPHVFLSRLVAGAWRPAERVDGPIPDAASDISVGVADRGRLAVFWISGSRVYGAYAPAGDGPQPLAGPTLLHAAPDGAPSDGLDAEMGINGTAYAVWRTSGGGGADVAGARLKGADWSTLAAPIDIAASNPAGAGTGRPRVAVDAAGTGLVAWGEAGGVFARRLLGTALSQYPQRVSLAELGEADLPEVDVEEDGSFGWVAFRQLDASGPRAIARRLVGLQFEAPVGLDTGPGAGPPVVSINGRGQGAAIVPASGAVLGADVSFGNAFTAPGRLDTAGGNGFPDVGIAAADSRDVAAAWRIDPGDGRGVVLGRYRVDGQPWEAETVLSRPEFGPVVPGSLLVSGDKNGNTAVAMLQGGDADRRLVVAVNDLPPGRAFPARGWVREAQPAL